MYVFIYLLFTYVLIYAFIYLFIFILFLLHFLYFFKISILDFQISDHRLSYFRKKNGQKLWL